jgi:purine-binding chemotaxis protein CheW
MKLMKGGKMETAKRKLLTGERFLSFWLDNESYCMEIEKVKELMGILEINSIPQVPEFLRGVINLRGQIIPIIDLRLKFGLKYKEYSKRTGIIVAEIDTPEDKMYMGIVVDSIHEVIGIPKENILKVPYINAKIKNEYILGIAKTSSGIKIIIDIVKVLGDDDFVIIKNIENSETNNYFRRSK